MASPKKDEIVINGIMRLLNVNYTADSTKQLLILGTIMSMIALEQNVNKEDFMKALESGYDAIVGKPDDKRLN